MVVSIKDNANHITSAYTVYLYSEALIFLKTLFTVTRGPRCNKWMELSPQSCELCNSFCQSPTQGLSAEQKKRDILADGLLTGWHRK